MGQNMYGLRPENLTTDELVRYALLVSPEALDPLWVSEVIKRLDEAVQDLARLNDIVRKIGSAADRARANKQ